MKQPITINFLADGMDQDRISLLAERWQKLDRSCGGPGNRPTDEAMLKYALILACEALAEDK